MISIGIFNNCPSIYYAVKILLLIDINTIYFLIIPDIAYNVYKFTEFIKFIYNLKFNNYNLYDYAIPLTLDIITIFYLFSVY